MPVNQGFPSLQFILLGGLGYCTQKKPAREPNNKQNCFSKLHLPVSSGKSSSPCSPPFCYYGTLTSRCKHFACIRHRHLHGLLQKGKLWRGHHQFLTDLDEASILSFLHGGREKKKQKKKTALRSQCLSRYREMTTTERWGDDPRRAMAINYSSCRVVNRQINKEGCLK